MIENSDRGITLNKSLAWTMAVGFVAGGIYLGTNLASLTAATQNLSAALIETRAAVAEERQSVARIETRVRTLENNASRTGAEFDALRRSLDEVKEAQRETNVLLRQLAGAPNR